MTFRHLVREPFVAFLLLGTAVFFAEHLLVNPAEGQTIRITLKQQARLAEGWAAQWGRPPSPAEFERLIDAEVRERIYYREALSMGLDRDDTIIRRRLVQKLEFLIEDKLPQPTESDLREFLETHAARYEEPPAYRFRHVYFSPDRHADAAAAATSALQRIESKSVDAGADLGDRFPVALDSGPLSAPRVARDFGASFADRLAALPPGRWSGPVESGYGMHLVYLDERRQAARPAFEKLVDELSRDYLYEERARLADRTYVGMKANYSVKVEPPLLLSTSAKTRSTGD